MTKAARRLASLSTLFVVGLLAGCGRGDPDFRYSFSDRHPLLPANVQRVDVAASRPGPGDVARIQNVAQSFRRNGQGKIAIFVSSGTGTTTGAGLWVRQEMIAQGIAPHRIQWDARPLPLDVVRVAFVGTSTRRPAPCTNLGEDIQQRENDTSWLNRETANFGCSYQANLVAQLDNRADLLSYRPEGPIDSVRAADTVRRRRAAGGSGQAQPASGGATP